MFVAGATDFPQDQWDCLSTIPTCTTYNTLRYINADKALNSNGAQIKKHILQ